MMVVFLFLGALALLVTLLLFGFVGCGLDEFGTGVGETTRQRSSRPRVSSPTGGSGNRPRRRCPAMEARP